jgi:hypothetical protein
MFDASRGVGGLRCGFVLRLKGLREIGEGVGLLFGLLMRSGLFGVGGRGYSGRGLGGRCRLFSDC